MAAVDDITLNAYLDGELDAAAATDVEAALARDPVLQRRLESVARSTALMRAAFAPALHEPLPERLARIGTAPVSSSAAGATVVPLIARRRRSWLIPASIAASLVLAALGGTYSYDRYVTSGRGLPRLIAGDYWLDAVANFHQVYSRIYVDEDRALVDVNGEDADRVSSFFAQHLSRNLQVPDLARHGFWLQGGRLLLIQTKPSAQIVYVADNGKTLALSILTATGGRDVTPRLERRRDANVLHWRTDGINYALVGDIEPELLHAIAAEIAPKLRGA
jgi:anti-sigma factor RsiW